MTQTTRTAVAEPVGARSESGDEVRDGLDVAFRISPARVLDRLYRLFISKRTGLVLILAMGVLSLLGTLLQQSPEGVRGDPQAYARWLDSVRSRYGGWTDLLDMAGMFEVFSSVWFKAVTVLLAVSILACSMHRTPQLWKRAVHPRVHVAESFFGHAGVRAAVRVPVPADEAVGRVGAALRGRRYRVVADPKGPGLNLYADRFRFAPFGTVIAHVSFVLILVGVLVSALTGFKNPQLTVTVGSRAEVGHGTGLTVEAKSFSDTYYPDGAPKEYVSELVLYHGDRQVASQSVRVNQPMRWGGVSFYQSFFGISAVMQVTDGGGEVLFDSGVPLQWGSTDGRHSIGQFRLPEQNLSVYVVSAASGEVDPQIGAGQMQLEIYQDGQDRPVATEVVTQGQPATISGLTYTFVRERQFTGLIVSRDPGAVWVWVGSALMVLGLCLVFFFRHRRIWVRVRPTGEGSEVRVASPERRDSGFESWLRQFVAELDTFAGKPGEGHQKSGARDA